MFRHVLLTIAVLLVLNVSLVCAETFINPPETATIIPAGGWTSAFPDYQRNVMIDFATDPNTWPVDPNEPTAKDLVPQWEANSNYDLEGMDDPILYPSDWFSWTGDLQWVDTFPDPGFPDRQGLIGVVNQTGAGVSDPWTFSLTLHLDNWDRPFQEKHIWVELELLMDPAGLGEDPAADVTTPPPSVPTDGAEPPFEPLPNGWIRQNYWVQVEPNPPWEELTMSFVGHPDPTVPGTVLIDYVHVATECVVPEPTTFVYLLGLGLVGLVVWRRRKRCD